MHDGADMELGPQEASRLDEAVRRLVRVSTGSDETAIFDAIALCAPAVAGLLMVVNPASLASMRYHAVRLAPELVETWMGTQSDLLARTLAPVMHSEDGDFWQEAEVGVDDLRSRLEVMQQLDGQGLGEGAGYKILRRTVGMRG